jgi:hypothetical protein
MPFSNRLGRKAVEQIADLLGPICTYERAIMDIRNDALGPMPVWLSIAAQTPELYLHACRLYIHKLA